MLRIEIYPTVLFSTMCLIVSSCLLLKIIKLTILLLTDRHID
ncbi:hypothetical protein DSUL_80033 [Desulfovibrionales bacterium]